MVTGAGRNSGDSRDSASSTTVIASGGQQRHRIPANAYPPFAQPGRQLTKAGPSLDQTSQHKACHRGTDEQRCHRENEQRIVLPTGPGEEPRPPTRKKPPQETANVKMK